MLVMVLQTLDIDAGNVCKICANGRRPPIEGRHMIKQPMVISDTVVRALDTNLLEHRHVDPK